MFQSNRIFYLISVIFHFTIFIGAYEIQNQNFYVYPPNGNSKLMDDVEKMQSAIEDLKIRSNITADSERDSSVFDIRIDALPEKCQTLTTPGSCTEATACTKRSGYYYIKLKHLNLNETILAECDVDTEGGSWTIIQRRQDGTVDFYRPWNDYVNGFGDIDGEFFIGLDKLHVLTNFYGPQELMIIMEYRKGKEITSGNAKYNTFIIGDENEKYKLKRIGKYSGNAGDSLGYHVGRNFSTKDQDNDEYGSSCAVNYLGAWWYRSCHYSNLNGKYGGSGNAGIIWNQLTDNSLNYVQMMIRRRKY